MANLTSMLEHVAKLPRSGFDMSQSLAFTASTGMILPVYSDLLTSSEKVYIKTNLFARTQPLVTPAMADVDVYLDWFFVPATMLLTSWGQIRWQTNDFISSFYSNGGSVENVYNNVATGHFPVLNAVDFAFPPTSVGGSEYAYNTYGIFGNKPASSTSFANTVFFPRNMFESAGKSMYRMMDMLGYNPQDVFSTGLSDVKNPNSFPIKALTYQCIYQNYFRNDDYEPRDVSTYNWDWILTYPSGTTPGFANVSYDNTNPNNSPYLSNHPFILRYADYRRDYFTSLKPSPILSSINVISNTNAGGVLSNINNYLNTTRPFNVTDPTLISTGSNSGSLGTNVTQVYQATSSVNNGGTYLNSSGQLRSLFAVEKLLRIIGRAAKDYDSQTLAHFGFKVPHDVKHEITHLHSVRGTLHIGEVVSNSDTFTGESGSALGELAGRGYVMINDKETVEFTAPVDGVVMCTFRAIPRLRVVGAFDRQNAITSRLDLFIPEFDKLGMQPLYNYEASGDIDSSGANTLLGWKLRYSQYKEKYDRTTSVFMPTNSRNPSVNQYSSWVLNYLPFSNDNLPIGATVTGSWLKCPPTALNSIMAVPYSPLVNVDSFKTAPWTEFYTDPFICDFRADVKKVSPMSPTGEPDMVSL